MTALPQPQESNFVAEKSDYVLAQGPDGQRVWIHKVTGEIRNSLPLEQEPSMAVALIPPGSGSNLDWSQSSPMPQNQSALLPIPPPPPMNSSDWSQTPPAPPAPQITANPGWPQLPWGDDWALKGKGKGEASWASLGNTNGDASSGDAWTMQGKGAAVGASWGADWSLKGQGKGEDSWGGCWGDAWSLQTWGDGWSQPWGDDWSQSSPAAEEPEPDWVVKLRERKAGAASSPEASVQPPQASDATENHNAQNGSGGFVAQKSDYILAQGPDGKRVWIHKTTGEIRTSLNSGFVAEKSDYVLAQGPDGKRVWIHKVTGEIRESLNSAKQAATSTPTPAVQENSGEKADRIRTIAENAMGIFQQTANQNQKSVAVAPPPMPQVSKPPSVPNVHLPTDSERFLPPTSQAAPKDKTQGDAPQRSRSKHRSRSKRRSRSRSKRRSRSDRRRSRSRRGGGRSSSRSRRSRSRSRKRRGLFTSTPPADGAAAALPTGTTQGLSNKLLGRKSIQLPEQYVRAILGHGGETIQEIMRRTGSAIKIQHTPGNPVGILTIANNITKGLEMIQDVLESNNYDISKIVDLDEVHDQFGNVVNVTC